MKFSAQVRKMLCAVLTAYVVVDLADVVLHGKKPALMAALEKYQASTSKLSCCCRSRLSRILLPLLLLNLLSNFLT